MDVIPTEVSFAPMKVFRPYKKRFASYMAADIILNL